MTSRSGVAKSEVEELEGAVLARPHGAQRWFRGLIALGVLAVLLGAVVVFQGAYTITSLLHENLINVVLFFGSFTAGLLLVRYGIRGLRLLPGIQLHAASLNQVSVGRYAIAEELLLRAEKRSPFPVIRRAAELQRASISFGRGDPRSARKHIDAAIGIAPGFLDGPNHPAATFRAVSIRALCKALGDDPLGAREDIKLVRALARTGRFGAAVLAGEGLLLEPLARVALAETILLAREGEHTALRLHLEQTRTLILESSVPRDRALLRGIERMLRAKSSSPYRRSPNARELEQSDEPSVHDWVERVLPEVAGFIPRTTRRIMGPATADERAVLGKAAQPLSSPKRARSTNWRAVTAVALMVILPATLIALRTPSSAHHGAHRRAPDVYNEMLSGVLAALPLLFAIIFVGAFVLQLRAISRDRRTVLAAFRKIAEGARSEAEQTLEITSTSAHAAYASLASLTLARSAARAGRFNRAIERAERGIASATERGARGVAGDMVLPELCTERAAAFAATGRGDEALDEIRALPTGFAFRARSVFRIRLLTYANKGAYDEALRLVEEELGVLPIDIRTELVADLVRAVQSSGGIGVLEMQRLTEDVKNPDLRRFLTQATPLLLERFEDMREPQNDPFAESNPIARDIESEETSAIEALAETETEEPRPILRVEAHTKSNEER